MRLARLLLVVSARRSLFAALALIASQQVRLCIKNKIMESEIRWAVLEVECFFVNTKTTLPTQNGEAQQTEKKHGGSLIRVICRAKGES
jgi:hypothetical protein